MDYTQQVDRYVFYKPLWRKVLPFFLLLLVWVVPAFLWKGHELKLPAPFDTWPPMVSEALTSVGINFGLAFWVAAGLTAVIVIWWYTAFEVLIISAEAITRSSLLGFRNT